MQLAAMKTNGMYFGFVFKDQFKICSLQNVFDELI